MRGRVCVVRANAARTDNGKREMRGPLHSALLHPNEQVRSLGGPIARSSRDDGIDWRGEGRELLQSESGPRSFEPREIRERCCDFQLRERATERRWWHW
jgi:hypothetical protein